MAGQTSYLTVVSTPRLPRSGLSPTAGLPFQPVTRDPGPGRTYLCVAVPVSVARSATGLVAALPVATG